MHIVNKLFNPNRHSGRPSGTSSTPGHPAGNQGDLSYFSSIRRCWCQKHGFPPLTRHARLRLHLQETHDGHAQTTSIPRDVTSRGWPCSRHAQAGPDDILDWEACIHFRRTPGLSPSLFIFTDRRLAEDLQVGDRGRLFNTIAVNFLLCAQRSSD